MKEKSSLCHLSVLGAWALAFGCAVGSDAFVMPWTTFLPKAGSLGTVLGMLVGGLVMSVVAWNYHYMINCSPGPGGAYTYAAEAFGHDHGFLCGLFLCFAYIAIVWLDVTALMSMSHYMMGDISHFGFSYTVAGKKVCLGGILIAVAAIAVFAAICCRRRLSGHMQTVLALVFAAGIIVFFSAAAIKHDGGIDSMRPLFSPTGGNGLVQTLHILVISPWLFVGFEAISNSSAEFRFSTRKSFGVMFAAIISVIVAYALLTAIPVLTPGEGNAGWFDAVSNMVGDPDHHAFDVASGSIGDAGPMVIFLTLIGAIFTNLVGNTIAASRLTAAMADDGALPSLLSGRNADGVPRNAVLAIAALAAVVAPLGQVVINTIVDISIVGAAIAYAYTSAATFKIARQRGDRFSVVTGLVGLVLSVVVGLLFVLPVFSSEVAMMSTESYLVLVLWSVAGLAFFVFLFRKDLLRRFGRSPVVLTVFFVIILELSLIWVRQTADDTTRAAYDAVASFHSDKCLASAKGEDGHALEVEDWHEALRRNLSGVSRTIIRNSYVQGAINILALALMVCFYVILRRREREMEEEKAKAKSYFFSTVSHDIRTPLNAIVGFSEMLNAGLKTEAERAQAANAILVSSKTLLALINDVLDLSKLESGKMEVSPEPTDCPCLLREIADAFRMSNSKPGVEMRCRVGEMPLLMVDPLRLRQILFNLVGNAMKFTERGHVEIRASFDGLRSLSCVGVFRIEVEDTGCGIGEEDLERLGSAYVQVGSKISRNGGTGLGLAICKQLAAAMGGALKVHSKLGQGSTFILEIPDVKIAPDSDSNAKTDEDGASAKESSCEKAVMPATSVQTSKMPRRLLIADDSKMNLMVLKALLKSLGDFEVSMAADGQEALDILSAPGAECFDLVLTDMWMPRLDGEALVRAIRANPALSSLRVVAVTADVEFRTKFAQMGFDGMLLKPITTSMLAKILAEAGK